MKNCRKLARSAPKSNSSAANKVPWSSMTKNWDSAFSSASNAFDFASTSFTSPTSAPSRTVILRDSSDSGCPLHRSVNALYHPKGAFFTSTFCACKLSCSARSISTLLSGEASSELKCAYGYRTILSAPTLLKIEIVSSAAFATT